MILKLNVFTTTSVATQIIATDLRKMPYPISEQLLHVGANVKDRMIDQETIDAIVEKECFEWEFISDMISHKK